MAIETNVLPLKDQLSAQKKEGRHTTSQNGHRYDDSLPESLHTFHLTLLHGLYFFLPFLRSQLVQVPHINLCLRPRHLILWHRDMVNEIFG